MRKMSKAICFDMDGTLIRNTNSVEYLCQLSGKEDEVKIIEDMERRNEIDWIDADYEKAKLFKGLDVLKVESEFDHYIKVIDHLKVVLQALRQRKLQLILITAGPIQVANELNKRYGFDQVFGSEYEVDKGLFTGKIIRHLGDRGKLAHLESFCMSNNISLDEVVSVGDSASDISIFKATGQSIALNYSDCLIGKAKEYLITEDLRDILSIILEEVDNEKRTI